MIPREEIEFTKAMADKGHRCEMPADVVSELCRVYLDWVDAPVEEIFEMRVRLVLEGEDAVPKP